MKHPSSLQQHFNIPLCKALLATLSIAFVSSNTLADSKITDNVTNMGTVGIPRIPDGVLEVTGGGTLLADGSTKPTLIIRPSDNGGVNGINSGTTSLIVTSDGNVGIGTSTPSEKLIVRGGSIQFNTGTPNGAIRFTTDLNGVNYIQSAATNSAGSAADLFIGNYLQAPDVSSRKFMIKADGKVGIGTTTPTSALEVNSGTTNVSGVKFTNLTSSTPVASGQTIGVDASGNLITVATTGLPQAPQTLTFGATTTWNTNNGYNATLTLTGNTTLSVINAASGSYGTVRVVQDATGSRILTLPAGSKVINGNTGIISLSTAPSSVDLLTFYFDGSNFHWTVGRNYN